MENIKSLSSKKWPKNSKIENTFPYDPPLLPPSELHSENFLSIISCKATIELALSIRSLVHHASLKSSVTSVLKCQELQGKSESIFGLRHLILEFLPKMVSTHPGPTPHAEKP